MKPVGYVHVVSLGCPKNLVDTEVAVASLFRAGLGLADAPEHADFYLINTCAFIAPARDEATAQIAAAVQWQGRRRHRRVVVCGCLPPWDTDGAIRRRFPEVDAWLGIDQVPEIGAILARMWTGTGTAASGPTSAPAYLYDHRTPRVQLTPPHYAYLKIAEGCDNRCAYCSIPRLRGRLRSRRLASVVAEARNLLANGVRELIIIAQDTAAFGMERPAAGEDLAGLLRELEALPGKFWLRLLYAHPASLVRNAQLRDAVVACWRQARHLLPYLDLPVQHVTDRMLTRMNRHVTRAQIEDLLAQLRTAVPAITLRTTLLVGHPGETDEDFRALREFVVGQKFMRLGVFAYSPEPDTAAAHQDGAVSPEVARARAAELMALQAGIMRRHHRALVGRELACMVDEIGADGGIGRTPMDAPEIDSTVRIAGVSRRDVGRVRRVRITAADTYELVAERIRMTSDRA